MQNANERCILDLERQRFFFPLAYNLQHTNESALNRLICHCMECINIKIEQVPPTQDWTGISAMRNSRSIVHRILFLFNFDSSN